MKLPFDLTDFVPSTHANLLIQVIHRAIKHGPRVLQPLYKSLVSIISNVAPYAKNLTKESSEAILYLIKRFSEIKFLRESEGNCKIVSNLMEAINYILQYHDEGNEEFLVTLIKYREVFAFIETLELSKPELKKEESEESLDKPKETESEEKKGEGEGEEPQKEGEGDDTKVEGMVNIPLESEKEKVKKVESGEESKGEIAPEDSFLSEAWEKRWKESLNLDNIKQAIKIH